MPEPDPVAQLDQARRLGRCRRVGPDAQPLHGAPQQRNVAYRFRGRDQQQLPGRPGNGCSWRMNPSSRRLTMGAMLLARGAARRPARSPSAPAAAPAGRAGCRGSRPGSGPGRGGSSAPGTDRRPATPSRRRCPARARSSSGSPVSSGSSSVSRTAKTMATGSVAQPAGHELQRLRRGLVQPLRVVHDADQRLFLGDLARAGSAPPGPARKRPARCPPAARTPCPGVAAAGPAAGPSGPGSGPHSWCRPGVRELHLRLDAAARPHPAPVWRDRAGTRATLSCRFPASPRRTSDLAMARV